MAEIPLLITGPAPVRLVLAHGAGAPMDSDFMNRMAELLAQRGVGVARFEFAYMRERRASGRKRPPDRQPRLLDDWRQVVAQLGGAGGLWLGGKSMGGRMASLLADEVGAAGLVCLGYPFHPLGKPERLRTQHLQHLRTPALICQGTRDPMGRREEVVDYELAASIRLLWLEDGDHDLKPRQRSGFSQAEHLVCAADAIASAVGSDA